MGTKMAMEERKFFVERFSFSDNSELNQYVARSI